LAVAVTLGVFIAMERARMADTAFVVSSEWEDPTTKQFVSGALLVLAALLLLIVQYTTRRPWRSGAVGIAGAALSYVIGAIWPIPFLARVFEVPSWARGEDALVVRVDPNTVATMPTQLFVPREARVHNVVGTLRVEGVQPGWTADAYIRDALLRFADGAALRSVKGHAAGRVSLVGPWYMYPPALIVSELLAAKYPGPGQRSSRKWGVPQRRPRI
jgi:hypothetical protein